MIGIRAFAVISTLFSLYLDSNNNPEGTQYIPLCYAFASWGLVTFYLYLFFSGISQF